MQIPSHWPFAVHTQQHERLSRRHCFFHCSSTSVAANRYCTMHVHLRRPSHWSRSSFSHTRSSSSGTTRPHRTCSSSLSIKARIAALWWSSSVARLSHHHLRGGRNAVLGSLYSSANRPISLADNMSANAKSTACMVLARTCRFICLSNKWHHDQLPNELLGALEHARDEIN
ncbi:hypothetical protein BCR44DRAFT_1175402 [Catenaria anguillulae PL171]|uniref:Uncharacterized protein n=1 Tax=Catenaria anguillulae PL171 TaxID=765915 RepID=A0A1Y2I0U6_9FUNG|nr:hypothetical protein BCR44DRAFT_1175402 [Catenaria anguillulae PL171]